MHKDPLDELRAANPLPELLPGLPVEVIRERLDREPPVPHRRGRRRGAGIRSRVAGAAVPLFAATVAIAIAVVAIVSLHHGGHAPAGGGPGPTPTGLLPAHPSGRQRKELAYIERAYLTTIRADKACSGIGRPVRGGSAYTVSDGSPPSQLLSILGVLRRPATHGDTLLPARTLDPFRLRGVFVRYIRQARRGFGLTYYVVPAANANLGQPIPGRCYREQSAALQHELPHIPRSLRSGTLALEPRFLNQTRHDAMPQPGICLVALGDGGGGACSYTASDIKQGRAIESGGGAKEVAVTWGLVPDGVATVTIAYPANRGHGLPPTATGKVISNVYVIPNRGRWLTNAKMVWRSATGAVVKTVSP